LSPTGVGGQLLRGEEIRFLLTLGRPGWVSLVVIDPDGHTYELDRLYLERGTHVLPPGAYRYRLVPPRGLHRVRAVYTEAPPADRVRLEGVFTDWDARLRVYLEASGARGTRWRRPTSTSTELQLYSRGACQGPWVLGYNSPRTAKEVKDEAA
jgi:hypothetical protein